LSRFIIVRIYNIEKNKIFYNIVGYEAPIYIFNPEKHIYIFNPEKHFKFLFKA